MTTTVVVPFSALMSCALEIYPSDGMDDLHLLQDDSTIVGDEYFAVLVLDHLIHTKGTVRGSDDVGDGCGS